MKTNWTFGIKCISLVALITTAIAAAAQTTDADANLKSGAAAALAALAHPATTSAQETVREARIAARQAYLLAEANEAAARQKILSKLLAAKTATERDAAVAELQDRWLAAKDGLLKLKAAAEAADISGVGQVGN